MGKAAWWLRSLLLLLLGSPSLAMHAAAPLQMPQPAWVQADSTITVLKLVRLKNQKVYYLKPGGYVRYQTVDMAKPQMARFERILGDKLLMIGEEVIPLANLQRLQNLGRKQNHSTRLLAGMGLMVVGALAWGGAWASLSSAHSFPAVAQPCNYVIPLVFLGIIGLLGGALLMASRPPRKVPDKYFLQVAEVQAEVVRKRKHRW